MIHDGCALKKVTIEDLYKYFNQDYKIDNIVKYFDDIIETNDKEYNERYKSLELSIDEYQNIIQELSNKFNLNRDNIRVIETRLNMFSNETEITTQIFDEIKTIINLIPEDELDSANDKMFYLDTEVVNNRNSAMVIEGESAYISEKHSEINDQHADIYNQINNVKNNINKNIDNKKDILIKNINDQYDKILNIIDHYHHIHDTNLPS